MLEDLIHVKKYKTAELVSLIYRCALILCSTGWDQVSAFLSNIIMMDDSADLRIPNSDRTVA
jgi:geranylgeranyl pyrophosphate synthase